MGSGYRMWYQRDPANNEYVDRTKGWSAISLPFEAEVVTTDVKGELTHFYQGSTTGHEYWLRELDPAGQIKQKKDANDAPIAGVYSADFNPLVAGTNQKNYTNTFRRTSARRISPKSRATEASRIMFRRLTGASICRSSLSI